MHNPFMVFGMALSVGAGLIRTLARLHPAG